jgi:hypothetical protein
VTIIRRKQGDTRDTFRVYLNGIDTAAGIGAVAVHLKQGAEATVVLSGTIVDVAKKILQVDLGTWINDAPLGPYKVHYQTTMNGDPKTWPEEGSDTLIIEEQLA